MAQLRQLLEDLAGVFGIELQDLMRRGTQVVSIFVLAWAAHRILRAVTRRWEARFAGPNAGRATGRAQRAKTLAQLLYNVGAATIVIASGLTVLNQFIAIGPLLAGVGVVGLAISFGAQSLVKDVIAGFFILLENQYAVDDIVDINGRAGVVERMTMRVVMLRDVHGILHVIPNGSITVVSNKTRDWSRVVLDVGVAYKENIDEVIRVMREVGAALWDDDEWQPKLREEPAVWGVEALADSSVVIRIVVATEPGRQFEVRRELQRRIKNRFDADGIEIPFPQRSLTVRDPERLFAAVARRKGSDA